MIVNGPDGKRYNLPDDATDAEITGLFAPPVPKAPPKMDTIPAHSRLFSSSGTQRDVMGIATPAARVDAQQRKKPFRAFVEALPVGAAKIADTAAALVGSVAENPETSLASKIQRNITEPAIKHWETQKTPEPMPTIGQNVASSLGELAPTLALGPAALPTMAATATYQTGKDLVNEGLPLEVAQTAAGMQGLGAAAMGAIPGAAPTLGKSAALALTNPVTGIAQRAATKAYLEPHNKEVAKGFDPLDPASLVMDVAMAIPGLAQHPRLKAEKASADTISRPAAPVTATPGPETAFRADSAEPGQQAETEPARTKTQGPDLDFVTNNVAIDPKRLNFEIGLVKNKKTSKTAVLLPPDVTALQAKQIAANAKMRALKQGNELYIYDPAQIPESTLRNQIKTGKNGLALGYGTESVPENGVPYAVDLDGMGTLDPQEILSLRDASRLGFSGVAPDVQTAIAKIQEMGRNDAEIRGVPLSEVEPNAKVGDTLDAGQGKTEVTQLDQAPEAPPPAEVEQVETPPAVGPPPSPGEVSKVDPWLAAQHEVDSIRDKIITGDISKASSQHIVMDVQPMNGGEGVKLAVPYNGTEANAMRVAKALKMYASDEHNASMRQSPVFATDEQGQPKYAFTQGEGVTEIHQVQTTEPPALTPAQIEFITNKVKLLGSVEAVNKEYPSDSPVALYAQKLAGEMYPTANNASGQTDVSLEATSELKSRQAQGIKTVIIDTRSGKERPAIGVRPEDNTINPYEVMQRQYPDGRAEVLQGGEKAKPLPNVARPTTNESAPKNISDSQDVEPATVPPTKVAPAKKKTAPRNILSDIRQQGGINVQSLITALDRNEIYGPKGGNRYLRVTGKNGVGVDQMAVQMADLGWQIPRDIDGRIDTKKFADILRESVNGNHPVHPDDVDMMLDRHPELSPEDVARDSHDVDEKAHGVTSKEALDEALGFFDQFIEEDSRQAATREAERIPTRDEGEISVAGGSESEGERTGRFERTDAGDQGVLLNGKREFGKSPAQKKTGRAVGTSELMDGFTSEYAVQTDIFKQAPPSSSTSHADTGGYAERTAPIRETTQTFLELPEVVKLAKMINEGKLPRLVERLGNALGRFSANKATGEASIQLRKDLFAGPQIAAESMKPNKAREAWNKWQDDVRKANPDADIIFRQKFDRRTGNVDFKAYKRDPNYVLKILAHEIGHNVDYLPDSMVKGRGNILGHIAALKKYMSDTLEMYPSAKGKALTDADKARFAEEAKAEATAEDIVETVTREVPKYEEVGITADMITEIWNGMESARDKNPDLYKFIAKMDDAEKKAVVVQAMKGVVHEALRRFAGKRQVGTETVTETITRPGKISPEAIKLRTEQLIKEEIIKRRLYEKDLVMDELKALTQIWKPFNDAENAKYTKYRYSPPELYADAVSVLFNEPQLLKDTAPTFYKSFFYYMGERPQFQEAYRSLSRLSKDPQALNADRYAEEMEMYQRGNEKAEEIRKAQKPGETVYNTAIRWLIDKNHDVLKDLPDTKEGREARYNLEEIPYIAGEAENHVRKAHNIQEGLKAEGVTIDDLSAYLLAKHIIANRSDIANTQGKTAATEQAKLDWMKGELGERKFSAIEEAADQYTKTREHIAKRIEESGIATPELMDKIKNGVDYAHIDVQKYMDQKYGQGTAAGAGWKKMAEGTLSDINNVFTATILQDIGIMRMAKINEAKRNVVDVFSKQGLATQAQMKYDPGFKGMRPVDPGGDQALLTVLRDGKPVHYVVDKHVADVFKYDPIKAMNIGKVAGIITSYFRDILVSKNPAWMMRNLYRDFKGTVKNNPEVSFWNPMDRLRLLKSYKEALKEVRADVLKGERSADIEMMHNEHMLNSDRMYASTEETFDSPLERIAAEFRFGEQESANSAVRKLKTVYNYLDKLGKVSEQTGKLAGMKYLRSKGVGGNELSHRVRTRIGTPDYKRQGALQQITNNIFMFSNVGKEGLRSAISAFNQDPISYTFKTVEANILPKMALLAAGAGLFGDELKETVDAIPSWVKRSYNVIPLPESFVEWAKGIGLAGEHDTGYIRLPADYEGQFFGSLVYDMANGKYAEAFSDLAQQIPWTPEKIHPFLKLVTDSKQYMQGESPYDDFRRKDVLTNEQKKYLEVEGTLNRKSLSGMGIHAYNMLGLGNIYRLENKEFPKTKDPTEAAFKQMMRYMGSFIEFTDAGKQEQMVKGIIDQRNEKAIKSYEVGDVINQAIRDGKDQPSDIPLVYMSLTESGKLDPAKTRFSTFRTRYLQSVAQRDFGIKPASKSELKTMKDFAISR